MTRADDLHALGENLYYWSVYESALKCDLACTALHVTSGLVIIDPIPLIDSAWQELMEMAPLRAVLLTNANHVRDAERLRKLYQVPIAAAPAARKAITELKPDIILLENEVTYGIAPIFLPGAAPGETAFYAKAAGVLTLGDAVVNVSTERGLELLPDKYAENPEQNRASLRKLLTLDFHTLTFAHGTPITTHAREKLSALLSR